MKNTVFLIGLAVWGIVIYAIPSAFADDAVAQGKAIYEQKCLSCHAADGSGQIARGKAMKVPNLRLPAIQSKTDSQLAASIVQAKRHPSFKKMSNDELNRLVAYMRTFKP